VRFVRFVEYLRGLKSYWTLIGQSFNSRYVCVQSTYCQITSFKTSEHCEWVVKRLPVWNN